MWFKEGDRVKSKRSVYGAFEDGTVVRAWADLSGFDICVRRYCNIGFGQVPATMLYCADELLLYEPDDPLEAQIEAYIDRELGSH